MEGSKVVIGNDMPELGSDLRVITQITPSTGWKAVFFDVDEDTGDAVVYSQPVVCWALAAHYDSHFTSVPRGSTVAGFIASPHLEIAEEVPNFIGYLPVEEDSAVLQDIANILAIQGSDDESGSEDAVR